MLKIEAKLLKYFNISIIHHNLGKTIIILLILLTRKLFLKLYFYINYFNLNSIFKLQFQNICLIFYFKGYIFILYFILI